MIYSSSTPIAQPLAASASVVGSVIALTTGIDRVEFSFRAGYLAVSGTTGVQFLVQVSSDGVTYTNAIMPGAVSGVITVTPAANVFTPVLSVLFLKSPQIKNLIPINFIKVTATNLDATNNAAISVHTYSHKAND